MILYVSLAVLLVVAVVALLRNSGGSADADYLEGRWLLDPDTQSWMERTCVDLRFADMAAITVEVQDRRAVIEFNDAAQTRLTGTYRGANLSVRQLVGTSEAGRFCGPQTALDISWRIARDTPDELEGRWATPGCELCPARRFRALRSEQLSD